jgi:hypothetical protein
VADERARQVGLNEALFREVNERILGLSEHFDLREETMHIVCECADSSCTQQLEVALPAYERVRGDPLLFFVQPGHELPDLEDVVESAEAYDVVRKRPGTPSRTAEETDPRS